MPARSPVALPQLLWPHRAGNSFVHVQVLPGCPAPRAGLVLRQADGATRARSGPGGARNGAILNPLMGAAPTQVVRPACGMMNAMNAKTEALLNEVLNPPEQERWVFMDRLLDMIDPVEQDEDEASFWAKVDRRVADVQDGKVKSIPADEAFARVRQQLRRS